MTAEELSSQDRLMAALSYPIFIVAIIILVAEEMKRRPFLKYHAVQALAVNVVLFVVSIILSFTVVLACLAPVIWLITLYWAYLAYQGKMFEIPGLTGFLRGKGWI